MSGGATPKKRGTAFEHSVVANLKRHGWPLAVRAYASKGPWDVLAVRRRITTSPECWLVQAKIGGYMSPKEREALIGAAHLVGATPVLATSEGRRIKYYRVVPDSPRGDLIAPGAT